MELHIPDYLQSFNAVSGVVALAATLCLVWFGTARMSAGRSERMTTALSLTLALLCWFAVAHYIGQQNVYWAPNNPTVPTIPFGILLPIVAGLLLMTRSARIAGLIDAVPLSWLVGVQFYRALGAMFLVLWWDGHLPGSLPGLRASEISPRVFSHLSLPAYSSSPSPALDRQPTPGACLASPIWW